MFCYVLLHVPRKERRTRTQETIRRISLEQMKTLSHWRALLGEVFELFPLLNCQTCEAKATSIQFYNILYIHMQDK